MRYRAISQVLSRRRCCWFPPHRVFSTAELGALPPRLPSSGSSELPPISVNPNTTKPSATPVDLRIPTRHSRKRLPTIITDYEELLSSAETILKAQEGSLFTYDPLTAKTKYKIEAERDAAWNAADTTVQTVEAILRGFAWHIPGTCWNRYLPPPNDSTIDGVPYEEIPIAMEELVDRLYKEGFAYMRLRAERLEEVRRSEGDVLAGLLDEPPPDHERPPLTFLQGGGNSSNNAHDQTDDKALEKNPYMHEFALPGPTTAMYDALLDVAAVTGNVNCADQVNVWHELAFNRHQVDGGCGTNRNVHTVPTALTFNALIRYASNMPATDDPELRDTAVALAFSTYQTLDEVDVVHKNSASVLYTLKVIAKFMPASRIRGNIAGGVFHQARYRGLINNAVIEAFKAANVPSNSEEDDAYIRDNLMDASQIPPKWKRESKKYRYNPREDVY